jgi:hypothetical protein
MVKDGMLTKEEKQWLKVGFRPVLFCFVRRG